MTTQLLPAKARIRRPRQKAANYLRYSPEVETVASDEHVTFDELSRTMQHITRHMATRCRHAYRPRHAKSHGVLVGSLEVLPALAPTLAQGLFAGTGRHPVILRLTGESIDLSADY